MARRIVVGIDGSEMSGRALVWASDLARRVGATLEPVMAWDYPAIAVLPFPAGLPVPPEEAMQADHERSLAVLLDGVGGFDDVEVADPVVVRGSAGHVLCDAARGADLLVVGSRGLGPLRSLVLGSVGSHCANHAPCPVALVPPTWEPGDTTVPARRVVVGVDGSAHAEAAVRWVDDFVDADATVQLVHGWEVPVTVDGAALMYQVDELESVAEGIGNHALELVSVERRARGNVKVAVVRSDARVVLEEAATDADLLVIGSRGHQGMERLLLGSVAAHVVHHLSVPTVVVRALE